MKIHGVVPARLIKMLVAAAWLFAGGMPLFAQKKTWERQPMPMKRKPAGWRGHGAFGPEMRFHHQLPPKAAETK